MPLPLPPVGPFDYTIVLDDLNNSYTGTDGADWIMGMGGNDYLIGGDGNDYLDGGAGNDTLIAGRGDDTLSGGAGNDRLTGSSGNQQLYGGDGDDYITSGDRSSTLDGGAGNDVLRANFAKGATHVLTGGAGLDSFELTGVSVLGRIGTAIFTDFQAGYDGFTVDGTAGAQILNSGLTMSYLATGGFQITLTTGDLLRFDGASSHAFWKAYGMTGADTVTGSDAGDRMYVGHGANVVSAGLGDDFVFAGDQNDWIDGGAGNDTLNGQRGNDTIFGGDGDDRIHDSRGNNLMYGGAGNDFIDTGSDASVADGGDGDDHIVVRLDRNGGHVVTGGAGADIFDFYAPSSRAWSGTIQDFNVEEDTFLLGGMDGFEAIALQPYGLSDTSAGAQISLLGGATITFAGISAGQVELWIPDLLIG
ncbi:MAG: calcium-binding protein [Paracoccaceae bacterium]